jgi:hypothetical protein
VDAVILASHSGPPGWWLAVVICLAVAGFLYSGVLGYIVLRRRRRWQEADWPKPTAEFATAGTRVSPLLRLVGGANVPTGYMRLDATWPLGVLDCYADRVALTVRGGRFLAAKPLYANAGDLASVFPVRGVIRKRGVGFRLKDGREWYFWTGAGQSALTCLAQRAFPVTFDEQRARKIWRAEP